MIADFGVLGPHLDVLLHQAVGRVGVRRTTKVSCIHSRTRDNRYTMTLSGIDGRNMPFILWIDLTPDGALHERYYKERLA